MFLGNAVPANQPSLLPLGAVGPTWNGGFVEGHYNPNPRLILIGRYELARMSREANPTIRGNAGNLDIWTAGYRWYPIMSPRAGLAWTQEYSRITNAGAAPLSGKDDIRNSLSDGLRFRFLRRTLPVRMKITLASSALFAHPVVEYCRPRARKPRRQTGRAMPNVARRSTSAIASSATDNTGMDEEKVHRILIRNPATSPRRYSNAGLRLAVACLSTAISMTRSAVVFTPAACRRGNPSPAGTRRSGRIHKDVLFGISGREAGRPVAIPPEPPSSAGEYQARRGTVPEHELLVVPWQRWTGPWPFRRSLNGQQGLSNHSFRLHQRDAFQVRRNGSGNVPRLGHRPGWNSDAIFRERDDCRIRGGTSCTTSGTLAYIQGRHSEVNAKPRSA